MFKTILFIPVVVFLGCATEPGFHFPPTHERWIEVTSRKDTLIFDWGIHSSQPRYFRLHSDKQIQGYDLLYHSMFQYQVKDHTILLYNMISSCYCFDEYSLQYNGNRIRIGNFYDPAAYGRIETFVKLE